jgi:hypothetical protein
MAPDRQSISTTDGASRDQRIVEFYRNSITREARRAQPRLSGGLPFDAVRLQKGICEAVADAIGPACWSYADKKGHGLGYLKATFMQYRNDHGCGDVPYKTFWRWFHHFLLFGETKAETKRRLANLRKRRRRWSMPRSRQTSFSDDDIAELKRIVDDNPQLYLDEIVALMWKNRKKRWSPNTIWETLQVEGYSLQKAVFKASQQSEEKRALYRERLHSFCRDPAQLIFIDETHKSANASRRRRAWAPRGSPAIIDSAFEEDFRKRYTLIGACDINGFVLQACHLVERETNAANNDPDRGTVDMKKFETYVETKLIPVLGAYSSWEPRSIVVMDNASIHISQEVIDLINDAGAQIIFTAPYSPDLNPIEFMFSVYKAGLKRYQLFGGYTWWDAHVLALKDVSPKKATNFFNNCGVTRDILGFDITDTPNNTNGLLPFLLCRETFQTIMAANARR